MSSGLSVGVPGTLATWEAALDRFGTESLRDSLEPAILLATKGFTVDQTFRDADRSPTRPRFAAFPDTAELFLPNGDAPQVGSIFKNLDLAMTLRQIALQGTDVFYEGPIADEIADVVQDPITAPGATLPAFPGYMTADDIADYEVIERDPTHIEYRGLDVYGMAPSSSGGTTVGESLNILENYDLSAADDGAEPAPLLRGHRPRLRRPQRLRRRPGVRRRADRDAAQPGLRRRPGLRDRPRRRVGQARGPGAARRGRLRGGGRSRSRPTPRASRRPTSRSSTSGATRSRTRSRSSRPAGRA